jgi:hypothetical protein
MNKTNFGKRFEEDLASSVPSYCYIHRLKDSAQSYNNSKQTQFSWDNECDFFIWNGKLRTFYAIECKSTQYKSMSVQLDKNDKTSKMVKLHQIESLEKISKYDGTISGLILNFRDEDNNNQRTYFIEINSFINMMKLIDKKSFNEIDLLTVGKAKKIQGNKKRTRWYWNLEEFFNTYNY